MLAELAARAGPLFEIRCKGSTKKRSEQENPRASSIYSGRLFDFLKSEG